MSNPLNPPFLRRIRSFVRREGRMTTSQQRAFDQYWIQYGLTTEGPLLDLDAIFARSAKRCLEIGFGMGHSLLTMAQQQPDWDFIGVEVHRPGVGALLAGIEQLQLTNIRIFCADAVEVLRQQIPDNSIDLVQLFFPDPWPKTRHHKRRIVQPEFVDLIQQKLIPNGRFHMATDWENYAIHMLEVMQRTPKFCNTSTTGDFIPRPDTRPLTKFEQRGQRLGHQVWDLLFKKIERVK